MKSHAFLVGVNVAASLPLVFTQQAMADGGMSSTASFLKAAVAEKATAHALSDPHAVASFKSSKRSLPIKRDFSSASFSEPRAVQTRLAMTPIAGSVKLRPFVPGRKLPSRSELQAQMPQLDNSSQPNLSATINESSFAAQTAQNDSNYSAPGYNSYRSQQINTAQNRNRLRQAADCVAGFQRKNAARSVPGQSPSTPGQVGFPCAQQAVAHMPASKAAPSEAEWTQMARNAANGSTTESEAEQMASLQAEFAASQPQSHATAGPAPFPLSLIPEASLKQLIGSTAKTAPAGGGSSNSIHAQKAMTPSYFGSWHGSQHAPAQGHAHSNLQPSGFHTYLAGTGNSAARGGRVVSASAFKSYAPMAYKATRRSAPHIAAMVKKTAVSHAAPVIATYGTYHSTPTPTATAL